MDLHINEYNNIYIYIFCTIRSSCIFNFPDDFYRYNVIYCHRLNEILTITIRSSCIFNFPDDFYKYDVIYCYRVNEVLTITTQRYILCIYYYYQRYMLYISLCSNCIIIFIIIYLLEHIIL